MCNCIEEVNKRLNNYDTVLDVPIQITSKNSLVADRVLVATCKKNIKAKQKPMKVFATFCPFCGKQYEETE